MKNKFFLSLAFAAAIATGAAGTHGYQQLQTTDIQFGAGSTIYGQINRSRALDNCTDCQDVAGLKNEPKTKAAAGAAHILTLIEQSPVGAQLVTCADKGRVYFTGTDEGLAKSPENIALFYLNKGLIAYPGTTIETMPPEQMLGTMTHELFHAHRLLTAPLNQEFGGKAHFVVTMIEEAAAFTTATMVLHDLSAKGLIKREDILLVYRHRLDDFDKSLKTHLKAGATPAAAELFAAQDLMRSTFLNAAWQPVRQAYILQSGFDIVEYNTPVTGIDVGVLKKLTSLPDGRSLMPTDVKIADIDAVIKDDAFELMAGRRLHVLPKGSTIREQTPSGGKTYRQPNS